MNRTFSKDTETFFSDFAERVNFCGIRLNAVITNIRVEGKLTGKFSETLDANTIERRGKKVSIKKRDFPLSLEVGDKVEIDGKSFYIYDITERFEVIHLYLQRFER